MCLAAAAVPLAAVRGSVGWLDGKGQGAAGSAGLAVPQGPGDLAGWPELC